VLNSRSGGEEREERKRERERENVRKFMIF
jgi:hypothetical protein